MCFHRRLVFGCAHHAWLGITRPCETEASFDRGETDTGCGVRWSHGYDTIRVRAKCRTCIKAQEGTSFRLGIVKEQLKALREHLTLIKGESLETVREEEEKEKGKEKNEEWLGEQLGRLDEVMEEVRIDPKHRALKLPSIVSPSRVVEGGNEGSDIFFLSRTSFLRATVATTLASEPGSPPMTLPINRSRLTTSLKVRRWGEIRTRQQEYGAPKSESSRKSWLQMKANDRPEASPPPSGAKDDGSWADSVRDHLGVPQNWIAPVAAAALTLGAFRFYQSYLRRIPTADHIAPSFFRRRSLLGQVTSVGDGDGFHLFHTPGGRLAGWGWLRRVPKERKQLKGQTIPIRIAGIDAPEGAHFGRPAQPFAAEAQAFLESYVLNRRVRARVYRRDQYERVVATVYVRRPPFFFPRRDLGLEMLRRGLAVAYEGKAGAEFGGAQMEARYREAEAAAKRKRRGLWGAAAAERRGRGLFGIGAPAAKGLEPETPMAYKKRMRALDGLNKGREGGRRQVMNE
ncbi:hypothetical protein MYCTH_2089049 [Thermothelomyces thermophilus ATCC 42464]|uniref:Probable endonuclease LCL3 n=1 Tax=Thermothelomyces thermophilus (strain ATCC 42464 / BCRC 31852 / DSM 1799) TaxID=573729 RepID=G2Q449_THET4|nr:uncharacterized protein MYCTH_2089049 [Thermothelomyces thermophilus ATCC 42464]AEO54444.1 hypothetical protein MYCTH_2089049 [Thermothelomyces thermophilus ATCC 42464]